MKLTKWFPGKVKPVHHGVYNTNAGGDTYQYWNGSKWGLYCPSVDVAYMNMKSTSALQNVKWRGIIKDKA